jgi:uncharacterized protein DUF3987
MKSPDGIPFMLTRQMKAALRARGFSAEQIHDMTPAQAHDYLAQAKKRVDCGAVRIELKPDRGQIETFVQALFRCAGTDGFVSMRAFSETDSKRFFRISPTALTGGLDFLVEVAADDAYRAANDPTPVVFCPPIAVFGNKEHAREQDLMRGLVLSVECDKHPQKARETLEKLLGPATVVVASGGEWTDPETGEIQPKLHLHWRLSKAVLDKAALADLKTARSLATRVVGADPSNKPIVHPIRWPGSWHRKGEPRLCQIVAVDAEREIDLAQALETLRQAAPKTNGKTEHFEAFGQQTGNGGTNWGELIAAVLTSESFHEPLVRLAAKLVCAGTADGAAVNFLRGLMDAAQPHDRRWQARYDDIPRAVESAREKYGQREEEEKPEAPVQPVDLWGHFDPPLLPRGLLPEVIERFAFIEGEQMGADPAGLAMGALAMCAAVITDDIKLQVKQHSGGWTESARLWVGEIGDPSVMKTPIMRAAAKPVIDRDLRLWRAYLAAKAAYDKLPTDERKGVEEPRRERLLLEDTTVEGAQNAMRDNSRGMLSLQDELSGWFGAMERYSSARGGAKDRAFWLQAFNGGPYNVDRVGRGAFSIDNIGVSLVGGVQPDVIRKIAAETYDDGLIQRLLPIVLRPATVGLDKPAQDVASEYAQLIERLYELTPPVMSIPFQAHVRSVPITVELEDAAQVIRRQLERKHIELAQLVGLNKKLAAHIGKYNGYFSRLCLIWHCIENAVAARERAAEMMQQSAERPLTMRSTVLQRSRLKRLSAKS